MSNTRSRYLFVTIHYGEGFLSAVRYTDFASDAFGFTSVPTMQVELAENSGDINDQESRIILPLNEFTSRISSGVVHSPMRVWVEERVSTPTSAAQRFLYAGSVEFASRNYLGKKNVVALSCKPLKARLDVATGLTCDIQCTWTVFKGGCGANQAAFQVSCQIASKDGQTVTINTAGFTSKTGTYWRRGYLYRDGLAIPIVDWSDADPSVARLSRAVPDDWVLAGATSILAVPGCDGHIETCRDVFNQEETFNALGYKMPDHHPNYESQQ